MEVLISAYSCDPYSGSEKGVGWNYPYLLSKHINITLVTRRKNKPSIEKFLTSDKTCKLKIIYFDLPKHLSFWKIGSFGMYLYYIIWHVGVFFLLKKDKKYLHYDLYHYLTFGTFWLPTFIPMLPIKFVWGPTGGAEIPPKFYIDRLHLSEKIYEKLRSLNIQFAKYNPLFVSNINKAKIVLSKSYETKNYFDKIRTVTQVFSESAINEKSIIRCESQHEDYIVVSVGRLIPLKGYQYSLEALIRLVQNKSNCRYLLLGEGEYKKELIEVAKKLNLSDKIEFLGHVNREEVFNYLSKSSVFLHPSMHDSGGWACIEAMSVGCPVIALKIGGPAVQVADGCGYLIEPLSEEYIIDEMYQKMLYLYEHPTIELELRKNCINHISANYVWDKKIVDLIDIYKKVCNN